MSEGHAQTHFSKAQTLTVGSRSALGESDWNFAGKLEELVLDCISLLLPGPLGLRPKNSSENTCIKANPSARRRRQQTGAQQLRRKLRPCVSLAV